MSKRIRTARAVVWGWLDRVPGKTYELVIAQGEWHRARVVLESDWRKLTAELKRLRAGKGTG